MRGTAQILNVPQTFNTMKAEYAAAKSSRFQRRRSGLNLNGSGADYHVRNDSQYMRMIEYSRDMDRNDTAVGTLLDRSCSNVFQGGFGFDPQTGDDELDLELYEDFERWSTDPLACDASGRFTLQEMAELGDRAVNVDGDIFYIPQAADGRIRAIEGHRLRTPTRTKRNVILGVMIDDSRRPVEYWITNDDIDPNRTVANVNDVQRIAAFNRDGKPQVWHVYDAKRFTQTRGVSALARVAERLGLFEDIDFANLVKAQIAACFAVFRETPVKPTPGARPAIGSTTTETMVDGDDRIIDKIGPGMEVKGKPGEKLSAFTSNVPNTEYFEHARMTLQMIAAALNVPLISMLLDGRETNFSGWRGAIDQAKIGWKRRQRLWKSRFYDQAWRFRIDYRRATDQEFKARTESLLADGSLYKVKWHLPRWPYIQPLQDAQADELRVKALLASPYEVAAEQGKDFDDIIDQTVSGNVRAIIKAIEGSKMVESETKEKVGWREVLFLTDSDIARQPEVATEDAEKQPAGGGSADDESDQPSKKSNGHVRRHMNGNAKGVFN